MRRRSLDLILSVTGLVVAVVLAVAGGLLLWGGNFAHNTVTTELTAQKIAFDADPAELPPELAQYAGMAVTDGPTAAAYADLIGVHVAGVADGKTYSEVSGEWIAGGRTDETLAQQRTTLFMGETLRGLLLNVYAFSIFGAIALLAGWVALIGAVVMAVLAIVGFVHGHNVSKDVLVGAPERETITV